MRTIPAMVNMQRTPEEWADASGPAPVAVGESTAKEPTDYYGLNISLENPELKKLGIPIDEVQVGDMIDLRSMAVVTSVSKRDTGDGACCRVELALRNIAAENEATEDEDEEHSEGKLSKLYR